MMSRTLAHDHGPDQVRVVCISPGIIDTPMLARAVAESDDPEAYAAVQADGYPLGRIGRPEEIASAVAFMASDEASFVERRLAARRRRVLCLKRRPAEAPIADGRRRRSRRPQAGRLTTGARSSSPTRRCSRSPSSGASTSSSSRTSSTASTPCSTSCCATSWRRRSSPPSCRAASRAARARTGSWARSSASSTSRRSSCRPSACSTRRPASRASSPGSASPWCPFLYWIVAQRSPGWAQILGAIVATVGLGVLSLQGDLTISWGDALTLLGALFYALHIMTRGSSPPRCRRRPWR